MVKFELIVVDRKSVRLGHFVKFIWVDPFKDHPSMIPKVQIVLVLVNLSNLLESHLRHIL